GARQTTPIAIELGHVAEELQAERRRLGRLAVCAAETERVLVLFCPRARRRQQALGAAHELLASLDEQAREGGVDDVGRRHAEVHVTGAFAELLLERAQIRDDVVARGLLYLERARGEALPVD